MRAFAACIAVAMVTILAALAPVQAGADDDPRGRLRGPAPGVAASPPPDAPDAPDDTGISASEAPSEAPVARSSRPTAEPESGEGDGSGAAGAAGAAVPERGELLPVLPFGTGLACLGLGIGLIGYRLRRPA